MKMMIVLVNDRDADAVISALIEREFRVTRIASSGGFLRRGNSTLMIGIDEERIDAALEIIRASCGEPEREGQRRATIFVLDVADFKQL